MRISTVLTLLEVAFLGCVIAGVVAVAGVPIALILGGVVGVVACEIAERRRAVAASQPGSPR